MSRKTDRAAALAVAATLFTAIATADTSGALAQDQFLAVQTGASPAQVEADLPRFVAQPVVQPLPVVLPAPAQPEPDAASLAELVAEIPGEAPLSEDLQCLAGAIYFEARGEPLEGQLAVADVIINRAESGRFPETYCGVVHQRGQFSFVRSGQMPAVNTGSAAWKKARAIALIAHQDLWDSPAEGALFFHASHVRPGWAKQRVATVSRHVFYR